MSKQTIPLSESLNNYLQRVGLREHPVMAALRIEARQYSYGKMQTTPEQALLLQFLARLLGVKRYLEVGVFTGYSLLAVALAMPDDGKIIACDMRPDFAEIAHAHWMQAGVDHKVSLIVQPAKETLAALPESEPFDLIYIDADKVNYRYYYERALALLAPQGMIALDNTFLGGRVAAASPDEPASVGVIRDLNQFIYTDPRVEMVMLPIGDGLTLVQKSKL